MPDLFRAQAVVLNAKNELRAAQIQLAADRAQLAFLLGRTRADNLVVNESLLFANSPLVDDAPLSAPRWVEQAKSARPDRLAAQAAVEQSEAAVRLAKRNRWPDVTLQLGYTQQGLGSNAIQPGTISAAISGPIPLLLSESRANRARACRRSGAQHRAPAA